MKIIPFHFCFILGLVGCQITRSQIIIDSIEIPFIKNSQNECYYLDEFMPLPNSLVTGKNGQLHLRYYTYKLANYKDLKNARIVLGFYSFTEQCWSLFEEYYLPTVF